MDDEDYAVYLQQRSLLGKLYRNWILYPRLNRCLTGHVLDFGCGIGDFLRFQHGTVGVDVNPFNVDFCCGLGLNVQLVECSGRVPYPDRCFDSIIMDNVLEHISISHVDRVLGELCRVLHSRGRLLVGVPGIKGYVSDADHKCFYVEDDLQVLLKRYNFGLMESFHMPMRMPGLQKFLSQYCIYMLFQRRS